MSTWLESGQAINAVLVLIALEALTLFLLLRLFGLGPGLSRVVFNLIAGACLLLALRTALTSGSLSLVAMFLVASFVAHLLDLRSRWNASD